MPKYIVTITTTFTKQVEVEANTAEEAKEAIEGDIWGGVLDGTDTDQVDTDITILGQE